MDTAAIVASAVLALLALILWVLIESPPGTFKEDLAWLREKATPWKTLAVSVPFALGSLLTGQHEYVWGRIFLACSVLVFLVALIVPVFVEKPKGRRLAPASVVIAVSILLLVIVMFVPYYLQHRYEEKITEHPVAAPPPVAPPSASPAVSPSVKPRPAPVPSRGKTRLTPPPEPPKAATVIDPEMLKTRAAARSFINSLYSRFASFATEVNNVDDWAVTTHIPPANRQKFRDHEIVVFGRDYIPQYRMQAVGIKNSLLGYIDPIPPLSVPFSHDDDRERLYPVAAFGDGAINPWEVQDQIYDLRMLLNEMEKENNLPLSCGDLKLPLIP
jgi:drug/metabolite transporter superfamily protein YnfA